MSLNINGPEIGQLSKALQSAIDGVMLFERVLKYKLDMNVSDLASLYLPYPDILFSVIRHYNSRYEIDKFVLAMLEYNPSNERLLEFAWKKRILQPHGQLASGSDQPESLERFLEPVRGFADPIAFLNRFAQITRCVCRISAPTDRGFTCGTGLLIGDGTVLTNYHVLQSLIQPASALDRSTVEFLFDFHTDKDGKTITPGVPFKLATGDQWLIDASPFDVSDQKVRTVAENIALERPTDKLDYAIVRLSDSPGALPLGERNEMGAQNRGCIPLPGDADKRFDTDFDNKAAIFIFQHPQSLPLRMDWEKPAILGVNSNRTRIMYNVNTQPGSSGSPCFNSRLELTALHHAGGKDWPSAGEYLYNQGIPIWQIYQALQAKNKLSQIQ